MVCDDEAWMEIRRYPLLSGFFAVAVEVNTKEREEDEEWTGPTRQFSEKRKKAAVPVWMNR